MGELGALISGHHAGDDFGVCAKVLHFWSVCIFTGSSYQTMVSGIMVSGVGGVNATPVLCAMFPKNIPVTTLFSIILMVLFGHIQPFSD